MKRHEIEMEKRLPLTKAVGGDLCIVGGGLAGTCAAITAARAGLSVILVQDRPVLGGNASSEVRLWTLGASAHNHNNNRWAREGGVIDELLVENMRRNREGNPLLFDSIILEKVREEPKITLLLNTTAYDIEKDSALLKKVYAYNSQTETRYELSAPLFIDASGDGLLAYQMGMPFRIGAENSEEFGEGFAPDPETYGELLGHSIFFMTKDTGKPVTFIPPSFALKEAPKRIPRFRNFGVNDQGCMFWWIEYGGRLDTIHDTEEIKWELWSIIYGVWDHIKNSGEYPDAENLTLEWMGAIPGKRESRRFETARWLVQDDLVTQREHDDAVGFGGWSIDLHPADGIYTARPGCDQYHTKGVYQIPFSQMHNPKFPNLLLAGRIVGSSHVAFGSTRVMATCAHSAQAVAMAAALSKALGVGPTEFGPAEISELRRRLQRKGQHIPRRPLLEEANLARQAELTASSVFDFFAIPGAPEVPIRLNEDYMQMVPLPAGKLPLVEVPLIAAEATTLEVELLSSKDRWNYTPEVLLQSWSLQVEGAGRTVLSLPGESTVDTDRYLYYRFKRNPAVELIGTPLRVTGLFALTHTNDQAPPVEWGIEGFEIWTPPRRPKGQLLVLRSRVELTAPFNPEQLINGYHRPGYWPNAWVASPDDPEPTVTCTWSESRRISRVELVFDTDYNHPMETVIRGHPESTMPTCVRDFSLLDDQGRTVTRLTGNYQSLRSIDLNEPVNTSSLSLRVDRMNGDAPAAVFEMRAYE